MRRGAHKPFLLSVQDFFDNPLSNHLMVCVYKCTCVAAYEKIKILKMSSTVFILKFCSAPFPPTGKLKIAFCTLSSPGLRKTSEECLPVRWEEIFLLIRKGHGILIVRSLEPVIEMIV